MTRQTGLPLIEPKPKNKFVLTTKYGTNDYTNVSDVVEFLIRNKINEDFVVLVGDSDISAVVYSTLQILR